MELLRGRFIVSPAPSTLHQTVSITLTALLFEIARKHGERALSAPTDVMLADHSILQPDLPDLSPMESGLIQGGSTICYTGRDEHDSVTF